MAKRRSKFLQAGDANGNITPLPKSIDDLNGSPTDTFEFHRTALSYAYLHSVSFVMSFSVTIAHELAPDRGRHPPLPDAILDNVPHIPWGTQATEVCIVLMGIIFAMVCIIFHKYRDVVIRRFCLILGTIYILRTVTIVATSLPILPPPHECADEAIDTIGRKLDFSLVIWMKSGCRLNGLKTCGDYMFSGHITSLFLANLFILEYSPCRSIVLRTTTCIISILGTYTLLAGRGHYTIDVIVAFVIVFFVYNYYHSLVTLRAVDGEKQCRWFPLFSYLERDVHDVVQNEFAIPRIPSLSRVLQPGELSTALFSDWGKNMNT